MQSRYYDPEIGRFLNADIVFDYDAGVQGYNLFVYCGNDPLNRIDVSGADSNKMDDGELTDDEMDSWGSGGGGPLTNGASCTGSRTNGGTPNVKPTIKVYRSVSAEEAADIQQTGKFRTTSSSMSCKQFGFDHDETAQFGKKMGNSIIVSAEIPADSLSIFYCGTVDPYIFRSGTLTVYEELLDIFNELIINIIIFL